VKGTEDVDAMDILNEVESKLQEQDSDDLVDLDENLTCHFSLDNFGALSSSELLVQRTIAQLRRRLFGGE